jgi:F-type H+-transporting ATPase subunit gamma
VNLTTQAKEFMDEKAADGVSFSFTNFGKKGRDWCRKKGLERVSEHLGVVGSKIGFNVASTEGRKLVDAFLDDTYDEVYLVYSEFISMGRQIPVVKQLLPIPPIEVEDVEIEEDATYLAEHICEPSPEELLGDLLPRNVYVQLFSGLLETSTSEHAARMTAMDNATKACNDMLEDLTLMYNKARQTAITAELMDIVGGAEALKG